MANVIENPADQELARLTAELDNLTTEYKTALEQTNTAPGQPTGIERAADLLNRAGQLAQQKVTALDQRKALEAYAEALDVNQQAIAHAAALAALNVRIRQLAGAASDAEGRAKNAKIRAENGLSEARKALDAKQVSPRWVDAIRAVRG